jgi:hypothetical protein
MNLEQNVGGWFVDPYVSIRRWPFFCFFLRFSKMIPAIIRPFPMPVPLPMKNPAREPLGRVVSCCWQADCIVYICSWESPLFIFLVSLYDAAGRSTLANEEDSTMLPGWIVVTSTKVSGSSTFYKNVRRRRHKREKESSDSTTTKVQDGVDAILDLGRERTGVDGRPAFL